MKNMNNILEALDALEMLAESLNPHGKMYIKSNAIREPLENAAEQIFSIYEDLLCQNPKHNF